MSATFSHAVRRLPSSARLVFSPPSRSASFTSRQPKSICLATYKFQCRVQPISRGYATQSNKDKKDDKEETKEENGEKKVEKNESSKPPPGVENTGFRHFFSAQRSEREKNQLKNEEDEKIENKNKEKEKDDGLKDPKPPQGVENSGFRHFFSNHRNEADKNDQQLKNEQDKKDEELKSRIYGSEKKADDGKEKKESVEDRVERMIRESKINPKNQDQSKKTNDESSSSSSSQQQKEDDTKKDETGPQGFPRPPQPPKTPLEGILTFHNFFLSVAGAYILYKLLDTAGDSREITWQEFRTAFLDKGLVDKLTVVNDKIVKVTLHSNATGQMYPEGVPQRATRATRYYFSIGSVEAFERRLDEAQKELGIPSKDRIPVAYSQEISYAGILTSLLPLIVVIATLTWLSRRVSGSIGGRPGGRGGGPGGIFDFSSSKAKMFNVDQKINVTFKDVAGLDEAKEEIVEFVKFLKEPQIYERLGAKIPRGAILSGPPGTGKTLLAKATAGEAGVPFLSVSGSEFVEMFVGVGAARVRDLFAQARRHQPSIIFIDEIDAIGKSRDRGKFRVGNDEREQTLNQILVEMDGFGTTEHVVVLAGTNRVDTLDPALMRPGRFDRHIAIDSPDLSGRKQIFQVHLRKLVLADSAEDLADRLSVLTAGFTGAGIFLPHFPNLSGWEVDW